MEELKPSTCPNCGSPLDVKPGDTQIKCAYCGSSITVSEHPDSTPEAPQYSFTLDDQTARELGSVGKVAGGIAIGSFVLPIIITVVVLCGVGILLFFVLGGVNSIVKSVQVLPPSTIVPLSTPYPTATEYPSPTEVPTPTEAPTDTPFPTPVPFSNVLWKDNFSSVSSGWDQVHETNYTLEYKSGSYHVVVGEKDGGQSVWNGKDYTDMSVEIDETHNTGPDDALVGVLCRFSKANGGYSFEIAKNGFYGIYVYDSTGSPSGLYENTLSPNTVKASGPNHIEGICSGTTLTMVLNGVMLAQVDDSTIQTGAAGLIARTGDSGTAGIDVSFNQLVVKGP
jgi:LSD1 subclass zinc finger protein